MVLLLLLQIDQCLYVQVAIASSLCQRIEQGLVEIKLINLVLIFVAL